jgi:hypothetical protein
MLEQVEYLADKEDAAHDNYVVIGHQIGGFSMLAFSLEKIPKRFDREAGDMSAGLSSIKI